MNVSHSGLMQLTKGDLKVVINHFNHLGFNVIGDTNTAWITLDFGNTYFLHFDKDTHMYLEAHACTGNWTRDNDFRNRMEEAAETLETLMDAVHAELISYSRTQYRRYRELLEMGDAANVKNWSTNQ